LNLKYIIDGTQVPANSRRELVGRVPTIAERWAYNQTLVRVDGLTNTEHKLEVHFSQHDQLFVRSALLSFIGLDALTQSLMGSSTT